MNIIKFGPLKFDPAEIGSQGSAVLGIRDSGKTYTATWFAERLFDCGIPFIAFDPIGIWRFLRVPGAGKGYPIVVAGGQEGDLPLSVASAPEIVRAAMNNGVSLVIDLFDINLSKADWKRIVTSCVRVLLHENARHGLRHVFIEEAAEFAPQRVGPDQGLVYAEMEKLARMGGNSRLGYTLINQRAEEVNKALLELCDNLFLHRQKGKNSLNSLTKWLDVGNVKDHKDIIGTLSTLPTGDCWAWPAGTERPVLVHVPAKNSLHPDRRVMRGDVVIKSKAAVDVGAFVETMKGSLVKFEEEAKANDPKALRAEIARLTALTKCSTNTTDPAVIAAAEQRGFNAGFAEAARQATDDFNSLRDLARSTVRGFAAAFEQNIAQEELAFSAPTSVPQTTKFAGPAPTRAPPKPAARKSSPPQDGDGTLSNPQRQLLKALAWWARMGHDNPSRPQIAAIAGWKITGGHLKNVVGSLNSAGLTVSKDGCVALTDAGAAAAPEPDIRVTLLDGLRGVLTNPQKLIFECLLQHGPEMTRSDLATTLGWDPNAGHLKNVIGSMRTLEIIEYPSAGRVAFQNWVRP